MKLPCKFCGEMPKYRYLGRIAKERVRFVTMECRGCGAWCGVFDSDPTALKYWNEENVR